MLTAATSRVGSAIVSDRVLKPLPSVSAGLRAQLPARVVDWLIQLGHESRSGGAELLLFGSFATGHNQSRSDLDLAVAWAGPPDQNLWRRLCRRLESRPTIRPVDLVDLSCASAALTARALGQGIPVAEL